MTVQARAFWLREPGAAEIRPRRGARARAGGGARAHRALGREPRHGDARVPRRRARRPARRDAGTVPGGRLPRPGQVRLPQRRPVVEQGPPPWWGARSSASTRTRRPTSSPLDAVVAVPDDVPPERAVLAGTVETAVNALWDAAPLVGRPGHRRRGRDGGALRRAPARRHPGHGGDRGRRRPRAGRGGRGDRRGLRAARGRCRASATSSSTRARRRPGCSCRSTCSPPEGTVLDLSWYGDTEVSLRLGGAFHSRRLAIRASQVGTVSPARRGRRSTTDRLRLALELLRDPAFDALVSGSSPFEELPDVLRASRRRQPAGAVPHHHLRRGVGPCSA